MSSPHLDDFDAGGATDCQRRRGKLASAVDYEDRGLRLTARVECAGGVREMVVYVTEWRDAPGSDSGRPQQPSGEVTLVKGRALDLHERRHVPADSYLGDR